MTFYDHMSTPTEAVTPPAATQTRSEISSPPSIFGKLKATVHTFISKVGRACTSHSPSHSAATKGVSDTSCGVATVNPLPSGTAIASHLGIRLVQSPRRNSSSLLNVLVTPRLPLAISAPSDDNATPDSSFVFIPSPFDPSLLPFDASYDGVARVVWEGGVGGPPSIHRSSTVARLQLPDGYTSSDSSDGQSPFLSHGASSSTTNSTPPTSDDEDHQEQVFNGRLADLSSHSSESLSFPDETVQYIEPGKDEDSEPCTVRLVQGSAPVDDWVDFDFEGPERPKDVPNYLISIHTRYELVSVIGHGGCGRVLLAVDEDEYPYAIKVVHKMRQYRHRNGRESLLHEKHVMERATQSKSRFLPTLYESWEDHNNVYFVMKWCTDTVRSLVAMHELDDSQMTLYCAEMLIALKELHDMNTMHRDIKPDNFLLDEHGHIVLCDLGLAYTPKTGRDLKKCKTFSIVGTPGYFAPEMIDENSHIHGYGCSADVFSLGLVFVEVLASLFEPFFCSQSAQEQNIMMEGRMQGLDDLIADETARDLLHQMLERDPKLRPSLETLMGHSFFEGVDWDKLKRREYSNTVLMKFHVPDDTDTRLTFSTFYRCLESSYEDYERDTNGMLLPNEKILQQLIAGEQDDFRYPL